MQGRDQHRRRLLGGSAAGLGVVALPRLGFASQADVVVIGAGLAGLNAAGHIPGSPELGAAQVGPLYPRVRDIACRLILAFSSLPANTDTTEISGQGLKSVK